MKKNILFVKLWNKTFINRDIELLKNHYNVRVIDITNKKTIFKKFIRNLFWADYYYIWFSHIHSSIFIFISKILRKKTVLIAGGFDCSNIPKYKYGSFVKWRSRIFSRFSFNHSDVVLAVSEASMKELLEVSKPRRVELVHNAVSSKHFFPKGEKQKIVITTGRINVIDVPIKGINSFVEVAKRMNDIDFYIIGPIENENFDFLKNKIENVEFVGELDQDELIKYYQKAKVYAQLSYHESFGIAFTQHCFSDCNTKTFII
jgi:glycosyltransferase involved in cell wall biosynthesis